MPVKILGPDLLVLVEEEVQVHDDWGAIFLHPNIGPLQVPMIQASIMQVGDPADHPLHDFFADSIILGK